jgi:asparagine synthetase A
MMPNPTINDRTLIQALAHADKVEQELPHVIQVSKYDWDIVILAKEVRRQQELLSSLVSTIYFRHHSDTYRLDATKYGCDIFCNGRYLETIQENVESTQTHWFGKGTEWVIQFNERITANLGH